MKYIIGFLSVFFLFGCSKDDSAGSRTFIPEDLTVLNPTSVWGETLISGEPPTLTRLDIIHIEGGTIDSQSGLNLSGLKVSVRVLGENGTELGTTVSACTPDAIAPGGSCTFEISVVLDNVEDYKASQSIEITPSCNWGDGTLRLIPLTWLDS